MQRKARTEKEQALKEVVDVAAAFNNKCKSKWIPVDSTVTGNFSSIQNVGIFNVTIDVSECVVTGVEDWPTSDFQLAPGAIIYGDFTSIGHDNTFGISGLDAFFALLAIKKC